MPAQLIRIIARAHRPAPLSPAPAYRAEPPVRTAPPPSLPPEPATMARVLEQLVQSLTILRSAAEQVLEGAATGPTIETLRRWLPPTARQAETAMQRLRALPLAQTALVIDLSQALTVLVLAADMLSHDQLTPPTALDLYMLLQRNADRAMQSLDILYTRLATNR